MVESPPSPMKKKQVIQQQMVESPPSPTKKKQVIQQQPVNIKVTCNTLLYIYKPVW